MPSARRKAFLLTFVAAWAKVRRLAGRDPPIFVLKEPPTTFFFIKASHQNRHSCDRRWLASQIPRVSSSLLFSGYRPVEPNNKHIARQA